MTWKQGILAAAGTCAGAAAIAALRRGDGYDFRGKVVLITGGSRGLGLQLAREFGAQQARVVLCARDAEELDEARLDLEARGVSVQTIQCDISDGQQVNRMVADAVTRMGRVDVLVNNAGVIRVGPLDQMTIADFEYAMSIMFWGSLHCTLAVLPQMRERGEGRIVNITSIGGKVSVPHLLPYSCAKFAMVALSEGLRAELAPSGVKVTTVVPGLMRTGSYLNAEFKGQQELEYSWFSLGAATPATSIGVERAARAIVNATKRGDAEKILSVPADLLARFHGAFPELSLPIISLVNRYVLPSSPEGLNPSIPGHEAERQLDSKLFETATQMGRSAATRTNELPSTVS